MSDEHGSEADQLVGATIRAFRIQKKMRQAEFAQTIGITRVSLSRYESGTRGIPIGVIVQIALRWNVPVHLLIPVPLPESLELVAIKMRLEQRPDLIPLTTAFLAWVTAHEPMPAKDP